MSDNTYAQDYAFPVAPGDVQYWQPGMTLRDWFAGQALAGLLGHASGEDPFKAPEMAYALADAMMEARK